MKRIELNHANFIKVVTQPGIVVVDCWAPWCGACEQFSPIYERVARRYPALVFASLDTQAKDALTRELGISYTPTLMVFRDGVPVFCQAGNYTEGGLIDIIEQAQALDMGIVKSEFAAASAREDVVEHTQTSHACHS